MKRTVQTSLLTLSSLLAVACGGDAIDEFMKLDNSKAAAFEAGGDDCEAKAKSVGEWRKANTKRYNELRQELGKKYKDGPPENLKEQLGKNSKAVFGAMSTCSGNEAFDKMMDETKE